MIEGSCLDCAAEAACDTCRTAGTCSTQQREGDLSVDIPCRSHSAGIQVCRNFQCVEDLAPLRSLQVGLLVLECKGNIVAWIMAGITNL